MDGDVMKDVPENRPQKLRLWIVGFPEQLQALGDRLLENTIDDGLTLA